jgi:hypothetical protein
VIWKITTKDFLLNLMTFKFVVGTILCVVLTAMFMPVLVRDVLVKQTSDHGAANKAVIQRAKVPSCQLPCVRRITVARQFFREIGKNIETKATQARLI